MRGGLLKVVAFGDIHIGNVMADLISFSHAMDEVIRYRPDIIVLLGDVIDGAMKYPTQIFKQSSIRPIDVQRKLFRWLVLDKIKNAGIKSKLVIIMGNHDTNFIENFLKPALQGYDLEYEYVTKAVIGRTLFLHYILRRGRGSYATSITPMMVTMMLSQALALGVKRIVFSHIHRGLAHLIVGGVEMIALPSFMRFNDSYDYMYVPCYAIIDDNAVTFRCIEDRPTISDVQLYNIDIIDKAIKEIIKEEGKLYV